MSEFNEWNVSYSSIRYLEHALRTHRCVESFTRIDDILFTIQRRRRLRTVRALLVNVYTLGIADVLRARARYPTLDCLVSSADWNSYTDDAKMWGLRNQLGVFTMGEFMGALWLGRPYQYAKSNEHKILSIIASLPENSEIYLFGSFLSAEQPSDLDVLVVYDETVCAPEQAHERIDPVVRQLWDVVGCPVDLTLLTKGEERSVGFVEREGCQQMERYVSTLARQKSERPG